MRPPRSPLIHWLSLRIRLILVAVFIVSLFLPPYVPKTAIVSPELEPEAQDFLLVEDGFLMKTSSLTEQGTRRAYAQGIIHTVESNESIASIAKLYDISPDTIHNANQLDAKTTLQPGQKLLILPVDGVLHTVKRGQSLSIIADLYGIDDKAIASQNKLRGGYLVAGAELIIPGGKPIVVKKPKIIAQKPLKETATAPRTEVTVPKIKEAIQETAGIFQMPCNCFVTQYFTSYHFGIDLQERGGGPIFAAEAGTVIRADYGWNGGYGNVIEIEHENGIITLYGHNKELYVKAGQQVARGQTISYMGNTGLVHGPTGIHLHFEVHVDGVKKNPMVYLKE